MTLTDALTIYGPLGVMLAVFVVGLVIAKPTHDRVLEERDRAESQRDTIMKDMIEQVIPTIRKAVEVMEKREANDAKVFEVLTDVRRLLERQ